MLLIYLIYSFGFLFACICSSSVNLISKYIEVKVNVIVNNKYDYNASITLINIHSKNILENDWEIYFSNFFKILSVSSQSSDIINISHVDGFLHKLFPSHQFNGFIAHKPIVIYYICEGVSWARTDHFPNWYVINKSSQVAVIKSTAGESLHHVTKYDNLKQRISSYDYVKHSARSIFRKPIFSNATERFHRFYSKMKGEQMGRIVPAPQTFYCNGYVEVDHRTPWQLFYSSNLNPLNIESEISYLQEKVKLITLRSDFITSTDKPSLVLRYKKIPPRHSYTYLVDSNSDIPIVYITYSSKESLFHSFNTFLMYVAQSLKEGRLLRCNLQDYPRFEYRGLMLDVVRNFFTAKTVIRLLRHMALLKMNRLHLHLTDDSGWRLEIKAFPELTRLGSQRCHEFPMNERNCLKPQLGSSPKNGGLGSGYYSAHDYRIILWEAKRLHITVIPEIDVPGHSHAAIASMRVYQHRTGDKSYALNDEDEMHQSYMSVQKYFNNAVNPCLNSTYRFVEQVMIELKRLHADIQPLETFHFGGNEVPSNAWKNSPACMNSNFSELELKVYFTKQIALIARRQNLNISGWSDGYISYEEMSAKAIPLEQLATENVVSYAWHNLLNYQEHTQPYYMANMGYKVVLSLSTHFYLDHPQENHPEERGNYWATRFIDQKKIFGFNARNIYQNLFSDQEEFDPFFNFMKKCKNHGCPKLQSVSNILGIQACLWTEIVRTKDQLEDMLWPRLAAVAERAWKESSWENMSFWKGASLRQQDYDSWRVAFTSYVEPTWHMLGDSPRYHVAAPGAHVACPNVNSFRSWLPTWLGGGPRLQAATEIYDAILLYSLDGGQEWQDYVEYSSGLGPFVGNYGNIFLRTMSLRNDRVSRITTLFFNCTLSSVGRDANVILKSMLFLMMVMLFGISTAFGFFCRKPIFVRRRRRQCCISIVVFCFCAFIFLLKIF